MQKGDRSRTVIDLSASMPDASLPIVLFTFCLHHKPKFHALLGHDDGLSSITAE
jgi:hypothetical protein